MLGRCALTDDGATCDFTASGIEFSAVIDGSFTLSVEAHGDAYFTVFIDGERLERRFVPSGNGEITVCGLSPERERRVTVIKDTEFKRSLCTLCELSIDGELTGMPPRRKYYLEFLGDSITSGYGNLIKGTYGDTDDSVGIAETSDGTQTYAFFAAEEVGADFSMISLSGIGVCRGFADITMSELYPSLSHARYGSTPFDFSSAPVPDLAVVNLSTNDSAFHVSSRDMRAGIERLISMIRSAYGEKTKILWVYGMMGTAYSDIVTDILGSCESERNGLYAVRLPENHEGGNGHPYVTAHRECGTMLAKRIIEILGA